MGDHRNDSRILGDINPDSGARHSDHVRGDRALHDSDERDRGDESMEGGSRHDGASPSGSRDVTEGVTGGTGTETGGTRNYRTGTGATGGDIGNRPE